MISAQQSSASFVLSILVALGVLALFVLALHGA